MRYTRISILDLLCASLQKNIVDVEDLKDVATRYRERDMGLRTCSLNFVVEALREDIFNVDELREAARIGAADRARYREGRSREGRSRDTRDDRNSSLQPGDWLCVECGHHNFARRVECQRENCKAPRPARSSRSNLKRPGDWDCEKCGELNFAYRTECHKNECKAPRPAGGGEASERTGRGGYGKALDNGDWTCDKCGTMNFARRLECFNNACKAPRAKGSSGGGGSGGGRFNPYGEQKIEPGDWVCTECDMVNFARRTVCHRTSCMKPRPVEA